MNTVLLDTNVASLLHSRKRHSRLRELYEPHLIANVLAVSFQTEAELYAWGEINNWGEKPRREIAELLEKLLIIPYDSDLAKTWGKVQAECQRQGRRLEAGDCWDCVNSDSLRNAAFNTRSRFCWLAAPWLQCHFIRIG